ncbi:MAG: cystatin domain-containing protein [Pirellulales bacterium]
MTLRLLAALLVPALFGVFALTIEAAPAKPGGYSDVDVKDAEVVKATEFAVKERNKTQKTILVSIAAAQRQVVAGMNYKLTLKVKVDDKERTVEAVVWNKLDNTAELTSWK